MFTHRTCWASPSFCRHQCLSASQWTASQRNCWGNSDRGGGVEGCTTSRFSCRNLSKTTAKFISRLSDDSERATVIWFTVWRQFWVFIPAALAKWSWVFRRILRWCSRFWSSLLTYFSDLQTLAGWHWPGQGQDKDKNMKYLGISNIPQPAVFLLCVAVWMCEGSTVLKTAKPAQNTTTAEAGGAYSYESPCIFVFVAYWKPAGGAWKLKK